MAKAIGIDLGTTNSAVATIEGDSPTVREGLDRLPNPPWSGF